MTDQTGQPSSVAPTTQRIDKWLWCARFFKTRTLAAKCANAGTMRVTRNEQTQRISKASFGIQADDTIVFTKSERLFIVRVISCATRRGPAPEARLLYEDLSPPPPPRQAKPSQEAPVFERERGSGRPTKKDRRALDGLRNDE